MSQSPGATSAKPTPRLTPPPTLKPALLRPETVAEYIGVSVPTLTRLRKGDPTFPKPIRPTRRIVKSSSIDRIPICWLREEIDEWIATHPRVE